MDGKRLIKLLNEVHSRKIEAFDLIYKEYSDFVYGVSLSVLHNTYNANDVAQEVFIKIYNLKIDNFPITNPIGWLYQLTKNESLMFMRKQKSVQNLGDISECVKTSSFENKLLDKLSFEDLISTLDATSKEIITLKTVTGLKHRDIANLLNIPEGTVRWRYRKALDELRTIIKSNRRVDK